MQNIIKNLLIGLLVAVPLVSIIVADSLFFPFITGKGFYFRVLVGLMAGLYVLLVIHDKAFRPRKTALVWSLSAFLGIMFIANLNAPFPFKAFWSNFERMEGFVSLFHLGLYFFIASSVLRSKEEWQVLLLSFLSVATYLSCFGLVQVSGDFVINQGGIRVDGTLGNAAYFGAYLMVHLFILLYVLYQRKLKVSGITEASGAGLIAFSLYYISLISNPQISAGKIGGTIALIAFCFGVFLFYIRFARKEWSEYVVAFWYGALGIMMMTLLYFTATRGAILGFIGGIFVTALFIAFTEKESKYIKKTAQAIILGVLILVGGFLSIKNTSFVKESPVLSRFASISWSENKSQARGYVWPMALEGVKERPILGWGQEGFIYVFAKHYNPKMWGHEAWFDRVHNGFLEWLVAGGILGFLAFLSLYASMIYMLFRSSIPPVEKGILFGLLSAYAFQSLFVFDNLVGYVLFFTLLGIVQNEYVRARHQGEKAEKNGVISGSAIAVTFGITLVFIYAVNASPFMQNVTLLKAMQPQQQGISENMKLFKKALAYDHMGNIEVTEHMSRIAGSVISNQRVPMQVKQEFVTEVMKSFDKVMKANPLDAKTLIFAGSFLSDIGITDQGTAYLTQAEKLAPKKQLIYIQESVAFMRQSKWGEAFEKAKIAYDLDPEFPEARVFYVVSALYAKQSPLVIDIIRTLGEAEAPFEGRIVKAMTDNGLGGMAKEILSKRIARNPKESNTYVYLASVYQFEKNIPKAKEIIRQMIAVNPETKREGEGMIQALDQIK